MKYRPLRPRGTLRSPRVVARGHRPWRTWVFSAALLLALGAVLAVWAFEPARRMTATRDLRAANEDLRHRLAEVTAERDQLRAGADTAESELRMARAAQDRLAQQLKSAESEAGQLKEDLGFFETLLPATGDTSGIHVRSFRVTMDETQPHFMHYRLLVMQGGSRAFSEQPEFRGELQFTILAIRDGKPLTVTVPQPSEAPLPVIRLTHYQRIEGDLGVPRGAVIRAVSVRILQNGQVRAVQSATP